MAEQKFIPKDITEVSKEYLETILANEKPPIKIKSMRTSSLTGDRRGYFGLVSAVDIDTDDGRRLNMVVKLPPVQETLLGFAAKNNCFVREVWFYNELLPKLNAFISQSATKAFEIQTVKTFYAACDGPKQFFLMENLAAQGYHSYDDTFGTLSAARTELFLRAVAKFHAVSMAYIEASKEAWAYPMIPFLKDAFNDATISDEGDTGMIKQVGEMLAGLIEARAGPHDADNVARVRKWVATMPGAVYKAFDPSGMKFATLIHGDMDFSNLMLRDVAGKEELILIDWQLIKYSSAAIDVVHTLWGSMQPDERRKHRVSLVKAYHDELSDTLALFGIDAPARGLTLDALEEECRKVMLGVLVYTAITIGFHGAADTETMRDEDNTEKLGDMMDDKLANKTDVTNEALLSIVDDMIAMGVI